MVEPSGKSELKNFVELAKEEDEIRIKNEKNNQIDSFRQLFNYKSQEQGDVAIMTGCTANVCLIDQSNKKIYFANSGDSRVILCKNETAYPMSIDHKPDLEGEKNRIYKADGWLSQGKVKGKNKNTKNILI